MMTFDFETHGIEPRPDYPPEPVGVAILNGRKRKYIAWGHPEGNNAESSDGVDALEAGWQGSLLCHNAVFDIAVAHERWGLSLPDGKQINDTMFLAFLLDPYGHLSLKPLAERYLGMPPVERDAVADYLYTNKVIKRSIKKWEYHICDAPGDLVGTYAVGDVDRTKMLFEYLLPLVKEQGMYEAYRRECELLPMLIDNSKRGIPLDQDRLQTDTAKYERILQAVDVMLRKLWPKEIGGKAPDNFDSGPELSAALSVNKRINLPRTPTGKLSTAKETLMAALPNCKTKGLLLYRSAIVQCLTTFMRPWCAMGAALQTNWNQVRDYSDHGAKTGRISSSPNLQNMTNPDKYEEIALIMQQCRVPIAAEFPILRSYIVAPKGMVLFSRDYSQQEFRMLAHYEDGVLAQAYRDDPNTDMHKFVSQLIKDTTGHEIPRKPTKTINFAKIYGAGAPKLAAQLKVDLATINVMLDAYNAALPSVKALQREIIGIGQRGQCITTLGGRRYYSPPAMLDESLKAHGGVRTYEYRLLNYLMQGGSADQTKQAMRLWWQKRLRTCRNGTRFLLTVHDQLVGCAPKEDVQKESAILDECMVSAFTLDVPTKTDPTYGSNFGEMA